MRLTWIALALAGLAISILHGPVRAEPSVAFCGTSSACGRQPDAAKDWRPDRKAAFARLLVAGAAFVRAVGEDETDHVVSTAGAEAAAAEQAAFLATLKDVIGRVATPVVVDFDDADGALIVTYAQVMAVQDPSELAWGSVDKAGIARTQRAWRTYRDTFVTFAATFPGAAERVETELTERRITTLEDFLGD